MTDTTFKAPVSQRINLRMVFFFGVLALLIGYPVYVYVANVVRGGVEQVGDYKKVDLMTMVTFPFDGTNGTINDVPAKWRALDGQKVILNGEIYAPSSSGPYLDSFVVVYSIAKCCVGVPPQVQHLIHSRPSPGAQLEYAPNLVRLTGTLHVNVVRDQDKVASVFSFDVDRIEPL